MNGTLLDRMREQVRVGEDLSSDDILHRARRAQALLEDDVLANAFDQVEIGFYTIWLEDGATEQDQRDARACVKALEELKRVLRSTVSAGQVVQDQLDRENDEVFD